MNSAMLVFLTVKDGDVHKVIFSHLREIETNYPNNSPYWYSDGILVYAFDNLFGWSCIGTGQQIKSIKDAFSSRIQISINKTDYFFEKTSAPIEDVEDRDENVLEGVLSIFSKYKTVLSKISESEWMNKIASQCGLVLDRTFCNHISGIQKSDHDYGVLIPQGFWGENELHGYFEEHVVEVIETLVPFISFRGTGDLKKKNLLGFAGVCQQFPTEWNEIEINFHDLEQKFIYSEKVSLKNGWASWNATFSNALPKGIVKVFNDGKVVGANKYYLLLDINIDMKVLGSGEVFKDAYDRNITLEKKKPEKKALKVINWNPDYKLKPQLLSDELVKIFSQLGEKILVQDPYLIGDVSDGKTTQGTVSFLNSLIITVLNFNLKEITFLVDPKKVSSNTKKGIRDYLLKVFDKLREKGLEKITIAWSETTFHDRYFLSLGDEKYLYHASKSINGFMESDDLNISLKEDEQTKRLKAQILYRLNKATKEMVIG